MCMYLPPTAEPCSVLCAQEVRVSERNGLSSNSSSLCWWDHSLFLTHEPLILKILLPAIPASALSIPQPFLHILNTPDGFSSLFHWTNICWMQATRQAPFLILMRPGWIELLSRTPVQLPSSRTCVCSHQWRAVGYSFNILLLCCGQVLLQATLHVFSA